MCTTCACSETSPQRLVATFTAIYSRSSHSLKIVLWYHTKYPCPLHTLRQPRTAITMLARFLDPQYCSAELSRLLSECIGLIVSYRGALCAFGLVRSRGLMYVGIIRPPAKSRRTPRKLRWHISYYPILPLPGRVDHPIQFMWCFYGVPVSCTDTH